MKRIQTLLLLCIGLGMASCQTIHQLQPNASMEITDEDSDSDVKIIVNEKTQDNMLTEDDSFETDSDSSQDARPARNRSILNCIKRNPKHWIAGAVIIGAVSLIDLLIIARCGPENSDSTTCKFGLYTNLALSGLFVLNGVVYVCKNHHPVKNLKLAMNSLKKTTQYLITGFPVEPLLSNED